MKQLLKILLPALKKKTIAKYFFIGMVSGLTNFFFINAVTWVIQKIISGEYTTVKKEYILLFLAIILIYIWTRRTLSLFIIRTSMAITWKFRIQILSLVINANYEQLFNQKPRIQAAILSDVNTLTNAAIGVIGFVISFIMAISCMIYLASVSFMLFCITLLISLAGVGIYFFTSKSSLKNLEKSRNLEDVFQANLNSILNGIKEINISPEKGRFLFEKRLLPNANESFHFDTTAITGFLNNQLLGQILFFMLIIKSKLLINIARIPRNTQLCQIRHTDNRTR